MKARRIFYIILTIILISFLVYGCKPADTQGLEERIVELEEELADKESEVVEEEMPEVKEEVAEKEAEEETSVDEEDSNAEEDSDTDADADTDANKEAPTISLAIYEGPTLDGSICYSRVAATVKGNPGPTVVFSKDDSG